MFSKTLKVAFLHPDLGIGGAERLVVDAALGLQKLGHKIDIYTSHHNPDHCFEETKDGTLNVRYIVPPFPRAWRGKFHILFAHLRQLHLTAWLLGSSAPEYDIYFVDQLSTCIPFLRTFANTRVVFYCHFPDKLLANGEFVDGNVAKKKVGLLKAMYRFPMDWLEEATTRQADIILANSKFTARVFKSYFPSIKSTPEVVYPGINFAAYEGQIDLSDSDITLITSDRPTLLSINRFEKKKNLALAISAFALIKPNQPNLRLVLAGGYDPRVQDNLTTLTSLISTATTNSLTYTILTPLNVPSPTPTPPFPSPSPTNPDITFLLNFTTAQRSALLTSPSTLALLYTPTNEHFGIGPVEGMLCSLPVLACNTGGPTESVISTPEGERTGWLCEPEAGVWAQALGEILDLSQEEREGLRGRSQARARRLFGMGAMAKSLEGVLGRAEGMGKLPQSGFVQIFVAVFGFIVAYYVGTIMFPKY